MIGHLPVMFQECMDALMPERGGIYMDATLGGGGHSIGILERGADVLLGIDKDGAAIERCTKFLADYADKTRFARCDYRNMKRAAEENGIEAFDGILMDLGVSSFQLDEAERGFSYSKEAFLDMRMDQDAPLTAHEVVNTYPESELRRILFEYGEEKFAPRIASAIVKARPIETTTELAEVVVNAIPAAARRTGGFPAKRTFQAIRIEVNGELDKLGEVIEGAIDLLAPGGRLAVITFHSLEDRAVKQAMQKAENPCTCPPDFPVCVCGKKPLGKRVTRKPILPGKAEMDENNRAHSAKLRVFEKGGADK